MGALLCVSLVPSLALPADPGSALRPGLGAPARADAGWPRGPVRSGPPLSRDPAVVGSCAETWVRPFSFRGRQLGVLLAAVEPLLGTLAGLSSTETGFSMGPVSTDR